MLVDQMDACWFHGWCVLIPWIMHVDSMDDASWSNAFICLVSIIVIMRHEALASIFEYIKRNQDIKSRLTLESLSYFTTPWSWQDAASHRPFYCWFVWLETSQSHFYSFICLFQIKEVTMCNVSGILELSGIFWNLKINTLNTRKTISLLPKTEVRT